MHVVCMCERLPIHTHAFRHTHMLTYAHAHSHSLTIALTNTDQKPIVRTTHRDYNYKLMVIGKGTAMPMRVQIIVMATIVVMIVLTERVADTLTERS